MRTVEAIEEDFEKLENELRELIINKFTTEEILELDIPEGEQVRITYHDSYGQYVNGKVETVGLDGDNLYMEVALQDEDFNSIDSTTINSKDEPKYFEMPILIQIYKSIQDL